MKPPAKISAKLPAVQTSISRVQWHDKGVAVQVSNVQKTAWTHVKTVQPSKNQSRNLETSTSTPPGWLAIVTILSHFFQASLAMQVAFPYTQLK